MNRFVVMSFDNELGAAEYSQYLAAIKIISSFTGLPVSPAVGCYKDKEETSLVIELNDTQLLAPFIELAKKYHQESILYVENNKASLVFCESTSMDTIGRWSEVSKDDALKSDAFTYLNGHYYLAK